MVKVVITIDRIYGHCKKFIFIYPPALCPSRFSKLPRIFLHHVVSHFDLRDPRQAPLLRVGAPTAPWPSESSILMALKRPAAPGLAHIAAQRSPCVAHHGGPRHRPTARCMALTATLDTHVACSSSPSLSCLLSLL